MPETRSPSESELFEAMRGRSVTAGWDVVVSYRVSRLNEILGELWEKGKLSKKVEILVSQQQDDIKTVYKIQLMKPTLDFVLDGAANARLRMRFEGTSNTYNGGAAPKETRIFLGQFDIEFQVPLVSMPAQSIGPGGSKPGHPKDPKKSGYLTGDKIVFLDSLEEATQNIVFKFHDIAKNDWRIRSLDGNGDANPNIDLDMAMFSENLHSWFIDNISAVDYVVASVTNKEPVDNKTTYLRPQDFVFASHGHGSSAVLSIYMRTVGSPYDCGVKEPKFNFTPRANPGGGAVELPVPTDSQASIIIRHELVRDRIFLPHLQKTFAIPDHNLDPVSSDLNDGEEGFRFKIKVDRNWIKPPAFSYHGNYDFVLSPAFWFLEYTSPPASWSRIYFYGAKLAQGEIVVHVHVDKMMPITLTNKDLGAVALAFRAGDLKIITESVGKGLGRSGWIFGADQCNADVMDRIPEECKNLRAVFQDFSISLAGFDYFATKNVFASTRDIISIDTVKGMLSPHDIILLGNIISPPPKRPV